MNDVSHWIQRLKEGEDDAVEQIWNLYFPRLVALARKLLQSNPRSINDEEDIALSALKSFFPRAMTFEKLNDRDDLWKLLATITRRKVFREGRKKGRYADSEEWLTQLLSREPTPDDAALVIEQVDHLLSLLPDDTARQILLKRLDGMTIEAIAKSVECSLSKAERILRSVKKSWLDAK